MFIIPGLKKLRQEDAMSLRLAWNYIISSRSV